MAELSTTDAVGAQSEQSQPAGSGGKKPKSLRIPGSFEFGRNRIGILRVEINREFFEPHNDIPLKNGDEVLFTGTGLKIYNQVGFLSGENSDSSVKKIFLSADRSDGRIKFVVPNLIESGFRDGGHPWLKLISTDYPGADIILRPYLTFTEALTPEEKEKKKKNQGKAGAGQGGGEKEGKASHDIAETFIEPVLEGFRDVIAGSGKKPVLPSQPKAAGPAPAARPKPSATDVDLDDEGKMLTEPEVDLSEELEQKSSGRLNLQDAGSIVGEYIDKTQGGIVATEDRQAVLTALASGDLSKLTAHQRNILKASVRTDSPAYVNASAQLKTAMEVVGEGLAELEVSGGGTAGVSGSATVQTAVQGGAGPTVGGTGTVSGQASGGGKVGAAVSGTPSGVAGTESGTAQVQGKASVTGATAVGAEVSAPSQTGSPASGGVSVAAEIKQNGEIVGEFLDKNPQAIPNIQDRQAILGALSSGNFESLTPGQKAGLVQILQQQAASPSAQKNPRLLKALQGLQAMLAQGMPEAVISGRKTSPPPAEEGEVKTEPEKGAKIQAPTAVSPKAGSQEEEAAPTPPPEIQAELDRLKKGGEPIGSALDRARRGLGAVDAARPKGSPAGASGLAPGLGGGGLGLGAGGAGEEPSGAAPGEAGSPAESKKPKTEPDKEPEKPVDRPPGAGGEPGSQTPALPPSKEAPPPDKPGEKAPLGGEEEKEEGKGESEDKSLPIQTAQASKSLLDQDKFAAAEKAANSALNKVLLESVMWVWGTALPTFGLSVLLGAIVGDLLWIFKGWAIKWLQKWVKNSPVLGKFLDGSNIKVKFSGAVKANILAMNAVVAGLAVLLFVFVVSILWGLCNSWFTSTLMQAGGMTDICKALDQNAITSPVTGLLNSTQTSTGFQPSNSVPGDLSTTAQWTGQINATAQKFNIDACILRVVVQKESGGRADIIGCDCAYNGKPQFCPNGRQSAPYTPSYPFNWEQCSYGIGLTQWTIFQKQFASVSTDFRRWRDINTPSRTPFGGQFYTVQDFLNPQTSLDLTAQAFSRNLSSNGGNIQAAFGSYVGSSSSQAKFVAERMALYNLCKGQ